MTNTNDAPRSHTPECWGRTYYSDEMAHCVCPRSPAPLGWREELERVERILSSIPSPTYVDGNPCYLASDDVPEDIFVALESVRAMLSALPVDGGLGNDDALQDVTRPSVPTEEPSPPAVGLGEYTVEIGRAGQSYLQSFGEFEPRLPGTFRWSELWDAMRGAAQAENCNLGGDAEGRQAGVNPDPEGLVKALEAIAAGGSWQRDTAMDALAAYKQENR